jgi:uncharacterized membrane protein YczE
VFVEFQPTPTAAFFDIGLVLLGVSPAAYIHLNLENVIREGVAASVGRGTSLSDVNVGAITPLLSWTCPALSVVLRVSLASPVVWSSIWYVVLLAAVWLCQVNCDRDVCQDV